MHAPHTFEAERPSWRLVVFLNVVRSIQRILKALSSGLDQDDDPNDPYDPKVSPISPTVPGTAPKGKSPAAYIAEMSLRLSPITSLEEAIIYKLIGPEERNIQLSVHSKTLIKGSGLTGVLEGTDKEFFVRPDTTWRSKNIMEKIRRGVEAVKGESRTSLDVSPTVDWDEKDDPGRIFQSCGADLIGLWNDPWVRGRLAELRVRLEEGPGL